MKIKLHLQHLDDSGLREIVDESELSRIKAIHASPMIKVFSIGHEGDSLGTIVGISKQVKMQYLRDAISKIGQRIAKGTKAFFTHANADSPSREPIGEVVGSAIREIGGKLNALAAVWIYPKNTERKLDVASIEANIEFEVDAYGNARAIDVDDVTGLALSSSDWDRPGFPGATLLGAFQAFQDQNSQGDDRPGNGKTMITVEEVRKAMEGGEFKIGEILSDVPEYKELQEKYEQAADLQKQNYEAKRRIKESSDKKITELQSRVAELQAERARALVGSKFSESIKAEDDKFRKFAEKQISKFEPTGTDDESIDKELADFIESQRSEFKTISEIFGGGQQNAHETKAPDYPGGGDVKGDAPGDGTDFTDPQNNSMIPE